MNRISKKWEAPDYLLNARVRKRTDWLWDEGESPEYRCKHFNEWHEPDRSFTRNAELVEDVLGRMSPEARIRTEAEMLASETVATAKLEGVRLNRKSVVAAILHAYGLDTHRRAGARETAMAGLTLDIHRNFDKPLTEARLMSWHKSIGRAWFVSGELGCYRKSDVRRIPRNVDTAYPRTFVGVKAARIPAEMERFIQAFNFRTSSSDECPGTLRNLGFLYLNFLQMRPFGRCNGMIVRALLSLAISRRMGCATPIKMSRAIEMTRSTERANLHKWMWEMDTTVFHEYTGEICMSVSRRTLWVVKGYGKSPSTFSRWRTTRRLRAAGWL